MPSWKKILISGSAGELSSLYAPSITGSLKGTASYAIYAETASISNSTTLTQLLVLNQAGFTINKGAVVRITGSNNASDIPRITTASYTDDNNSANTLGIASANITNGSQGYVITEGVLTGIDTTGWPSGTLLFLGATGSITASAPQAPLHAVRLGQVIREQNNNGSIHIRVDNGYELGELHDVTDNTTTTSYGDLLVKSGSVWTNSKQLTGSYGLTGSLQIAGSTSTDLVIINQTGTGNAFVVEDETNPDATPFVISNSGCVGIGVASNNPLFSSNTKLQIYTSGSLQRALRIRETNTSSSFNFWAITSSDGTRILRLDQDTTGTNVMTWAQTGNVGIGTTTPNTKLDVNGSSVINGSLTVGSSSLGPNENTITLGARDNGSEGGQIGFNAPGGTYTSASMIDNYQNKFRILRGTNAGSDAEYFSLNLHSGQVVFNKYTGSGAFSGTAAGYLAFDTSGNIITTAGVGSAVNIGNSDLTITSNETRVLSHTGTSRLIISKSSDANSLLELDNATTSNGRMLYMKSKLNGESQRDSVRILTAAGNDADDSQFNGWMNEHIVEYVSGSAVVPNKLKGWSWSYYTEFDNGFGTTPIYKDVLLISTSNAATLNASLKVTGSTYLTGLPAGTTSNVVYIDTTTGALSYGAGSSNAFPYTGSAQITGSLGVTGSLNFPSAISVNNASKIHVAKYPNPSGSLTAGVDSVLYNYGRSTEGLILQYRDQNFGDVGGLKITDTGVAIFGSGDNDVLKVINEDNNTQVFSINNSGYVGINKTGVSAQQTEANAYLDVNGTAIISGSFTTTSGVSLKGLSSATTSNVVYIDTTTGALSYGLAVSGSINISGSGNAFPYTGSAQITGSLGVTGSIGVSGNAPSVTILGNTASLAVTDVVKDNSTDIAPGYIGITGNAGHSPIVEKISYTTKPYYSPWFTAYDSDHPIDATYVASGSNGFDASAVLTNTVLNLRRYWGHNGTDYYAGFEELVRAGDPWDANNASADWFILLGSTGSIVPNVVLSITANTGKLWDNTTTGISSTNNYNQQCAITPQAVFGSDVKMLSDIQVQGKFVDSDASNTIDNKALIQAGLLYLSNNF